MAQGNGGIIGKLNAPTVDAAAGVWTKRDMELAQQANKWPQTAYQYQIARSLRFNSADSAYLDRNAATITNRNIWTWSAWVKRVNISDSQYSLFGARYDANSYDEFRFTTADKFRFFVVGSGSVVLDLLTTQVFRDVSAWYHIVVSVDTTQATASNRAKLYINGVQVTAFDTATYPSQNYGPVINFASQSIGYSVAAGFRFNGYMADVRFIDGQALTPTSFGEYDANTGVWIPKAYAGTYGANGFWLKFSDNSNTTAATLGVDSSGNGNNWTPNNFSVTAGAGNDSMVDSPTLYGTDTGVGGTVRGNYCTWNPLKNPQVAVLTNGNLDLSTAGSTARLGTYTTIGVTTGKWYWEITAGSLSTDGYNIGIVNASKPDTTALNADTNSYIYLESGAKGYNGTGTAYGASYTAGDVIGVALDLDAGTLVFYKNGTSQGTAFTSIASNTWFPTVADNATGSTTGSSFIANFGQRPFAYTAPSGFKALCTQNLPVPAVGAAAGNRAGNHFNAITFVGDSASPRAMTGFGFSPDLIWSARRDVSYGIQIFDSVRGAGNRLNTGYSGLNTAAESSGYGLVNSFDADGYTSTAVDQASNNSGGSYVTWAWNAGESTVSNTAGSITSSVRANPTAGISVVTYTGSGANATVGHGLGVAPSMVIAKKRSSTGNWQTYHSALGATKTMFLDLADAAYTNSLYWNNTAPTSSAFSIGGNTDVNANGATFVAYCFAEVQGFSKFGSYTGNGSADGTFVYCGFRPRWIMVKDSVNASWPWWIVDTVRGTVNPLSYYITTNTGNAETNNFSGYVICDAVSNGFKMRSSDAYGNTSGDTYIFAAFAEFPFKYGLAR